MRAPQTYLAGILLVVLCATARTSESASYAGPAMPVDAAFFGMHIHRAAAGTPWPAAPFAGWRLWDAGVSWPQLEPERGKWNFALLDRYAQIAREHHVEIVLTLGLTPAWASTRPEQPSAYGTGNAAEPRQIADWAEYICVVATRYKGVIRYYEIWNEPNVPGTFTGGVPAMLELTRTAYLILKSVDPSIRVISPSATTDEGLPWLDTFLQEGGCHYFDIVGYHFYVTPARPETMIPLIEKVKNILHRDHCDRPLWNTESGWSEPKQFSSNEEAAGYLMRTYLLSWLMGVQRVYWYAWDNHNWSTLDLTSRSTGAATSAGAAYGVIRSWMLGAVLRHCGRSRTGIWVCELERDSGTSRVAWSDSGEQQLATPTPWDAHAMTSWTGQTSLTGRQITFGAAPVLLSSKAAAPPN
jgi:hypothetical protein